jgi:hypothetical protein
MQHAETTARLRISVLVYTAAEGKPDGRQTCKKEPV